MTINAQGITDDDEIFCAACGVPHTDATEYLARVKEERELLERELRGKRAQIKRLRAEQDDAMRTSPLFPAANAVLELWRELCMPTAREIGGKRLELCIQRLKAGETRDRLEMSVRGYAKFPYVVNRRRMSAGRPGQWYADATLIFRSATHVDQGIRLFEEGQDAPIVQAVKGLEMSSLGAAAVKYAGFGWHVFPVLPQRKEPATKHGLLDAVCDAARVEAFWAERPHFNVGIRTGEESGIVVLDVDGEIGSESLRLLETEHEKLPRTASVVTPRGGQHFYFRHPGTPVYNTTGFPAEGLDIRGDGGYVLGVPSVHPNGGTYEPDEQAPLAEMPEWLLTLIANRQGRRLQAVDPSEWTAIVTRGATSGSRNHQMLRLAGHLMSKGLDPGVVLGIAQNTNREVNRPPLSDGEVEKIVNSVVRMRSRNAA